MLTTSEQQVINASNSHYDARQQALRDYQAALLQALEDLKVALERAVEELKAAEKQADLARQTALQPVYDDFFNSWLAQVSKTQE